MFEDKDVKLWNENVARGSKITASVYLRRLGSFCNENKVSPRELAQFDPNHSYRLILKTVGAMESKGHAGSYIASVVKVIRSWLAFNGVEIKGRVKIRGAYDTPSLRDERVPSQEELRKIVLAADQKTRAVCILLAHSGVRPEVVGNYDGSDGLRVKDLPEMEIADGIVKFSKIPTLVRVRSSLSKKANEYFTFLSTEGCDYVKSYLEMRMRGGEKLASESAIVTPKIAKKDFIATVNIGDAARKAIRKAGFPWRPYVLRSYFDTQLMLAESKGLIIRDYRSFFMGHKGDIEHVYTLNKKRLPPQVIDQMRDSYAKAQTFLLTTDAGTPREDEARRMKRGMLLMAGFKSAEITEELFAMNDDEFHSFVIARLAESIKSNSPGQKVVAVKEIETYLSQGWQFVGLLPEDRAIIRQPDLV